MARPEKCKRICALPEKNRFSCEGGDSSTDPQIISLEEFETVRLIDYIGLTQEQCASQMHVARTTVQRLYTDARKKIAEFLIAGTALEISGGNYKICENSDTCCRVSYCPKKSFGCDCEFRTAGCIISTLEKPSQEKVCEIQRMD